MTCETCRGYSDWICPCCKTPEDDAEILRANGELESWYQEQTEVCKDAVDEQINTIAQKCDQEEIVRDLLIVWAKGSIPGYREGTDLAARWCDG